MDEWGRQQFLNLIRSVLGGFAAGQDVKALRWQLQDGLEEWDRADAEAWLERRARRLKPRKPRMTQAAIRRNGMARRAAARTREASREYP